MPPISSSACRLIQTPQLQCGGFGEFERDGATVRSVSFSVVDNEYPTGRDALGPVLRELLGLATLSGDRVQHHNVPGARVRVVTFEDGLEVGRGSSW